MKKEQLEFREAAISFSTPFDEENEEYTSLFKAMRKREIFATMMSLFGATFGIGSMGLPGTMAKVGVIPWFLLFGISWLINFITFYSMLYFADKMKLNNLVELSQMLGGKKTYMTILILFVLSTIFRLLSAMAVFNGLISNVVKECGVQSIYFISKDSLVWMLLPTLVLFPILIKKKLKSLAATTFISMASAFYLISFLIYSYTTQLDEPNQPDQNINADFSSVWAIPSVYGYLLASTGCQSNLMSIFNETSTKSIPIMKKILWLHFGFFVVIYTGIAVCGFMLFGHNEDILKNPILELFESSSNPALLIANVLMIISALNSFVFGFKPLKDTLLKLFEGEAKENQAPEEIKGDWDPFNLSLTTSLACLFLLISGLCVLGKIGFLQIITFSSNVIIPILFTFIPLVVAYKDKKSKLIVFALSVAGFFYIWKMIDYAWPMAFKLVDWITSFATRAESVVEVLGQ